jgi:hypothetical protein
VKDRGPEAAPAWTATEHACAQERAAAIGNARFDAAAAQPVRAARDTFLIRPGAVLHVESAVPGEGGDASPHAALEACDAAMPGVNSGEAEKNGGEKMATAARPGSRHGHPV